MNLFVFLLKLNISWLPFKWKMEFRTNDIWVLTVLLDVTYCFVLCNENIEFRLIVSFPLQSCNTYLRFKKTQQHIKNATINTVNIFKFTKIIQYFVLAVSSNNIISMKEYKTKKQNYLWKFNYLLCSVNPHKKDAQKIILILLEECEEGFLWNKENWLTCTKICMLFAHLSIFHIYSYIPS